MDNLRSALVTQIGTAVADLTTYDKFSTEYAEREVVLGRLPITDALLCVGDWRVREREAHSWNRNKVRNEIDVILFVRDPDYLADYNIDDQLQQGLSLSNLGNDGYEVINCAVEQVDPQQQIHDNIWKRRYLITFISIETRS